MLVCKYNKYAEIPGSEFFAEHIPIFATQNYADYIKETKKHDIAWFAYSENGIVSYLLPFAVIKKIIFRKGYFVTGIISFDPDNTPEKEKEFLENVIIYIKKNKLCDWIQQGPNWALFNIAPSGAKAVKFGTYKISLKDKNEENLFKLIKYKARQDINKAIRSKVKVIKGTDFINNCLQIINYTAINADLQLLTLNDVNKLLFHFNDHLKIYISYKDDIPQSSTIFLGNEYCVYALYAGSKKPFRGSSVYLYWEAIKDAKKKNCCYFDFVGARINPTPGSKQEKIQRFKEHFGGELVQGYLWKMNNSIFKYYVYQILVRIIYLVKMKKYKPDIIDQELKRMKKEINIKSNH